MDAVERSAPVSRLERSSHTALIDNNTLFVWGGYQVRNLCVCVYATIYLCRCVCNRRDKGNKPFEPDSPPDAPEFIFLQLN